MSHAPSAGFELQNPKCHRADYFTRRGRVLGARCDEVSNPEGGFLFGSDVNDRHAAVHEFTELEVTVVSVFRVGGDHRRVTCGIEVCINLHAALL